MKTATSDQPAAANNSPASARPTHPPETFARVWLPTLVVALFIITFVVQAFEIPSGSMEKTLLIGDHLLVDRVCFAPPPSVHWLADLLPYRPLRHGDILVFMSPVEPDMHLVKRVIGLPGDHIKLVNRVVYRNGVALKEPYANFSGHQGNAGVDNFPTLPFYGQTDAWAAIEPNYIQNGELVVPPGHYFVMGDNREDSYDSRYWGFVPQANVIGRPAIIYWSYRSTAADYLQTTLGARFVSLLSTLVHAPFRTRWSRCLRIPR